jgi:hypothetical protein
MLYARRKRQEALAEAEAAGESFWSTQFNKQARMKLVHAFRDACPESLQEKYAELARGLILRDEGLPYLTNEDVRYEVDLLNFVMTCHDFIVPTTIEAIAVAFTTPLSRMGGGQSHSGPYRSADRQNFTSTVNTVLREHRISFELIGQEMVPLASQELHTELVAPTLRLLSGRAGWDKVETAYQDALRELADGKPGDAITDAATALQEALVALGCEGNALGRLAKSARAKGLLGPHDALVTDMLHKLIDWVSADRSVKGDAHQATRPSVEDGWLAVHIVGALILRLTGTRRS